MRQRLQKELKQNSVRAVDWPAEILAVHQHPFMRIVIETESCRSKVTAGERGKYYRNTVIPLARRGGEGGEGANVEYMFATSFR